MLSAFHSARQLHYGIEFAFHIAGQLKNICCLNSRGPDIIVDRVGCSPRALSLKPLTYIRCRIVLVESVGYKKRFYLLHISLLWPFPFLLLFFTAYGPSYYRPIVHSFVGWCLLFLQSLISRRVCYICLFFPNASGSSTKEDASFSSVL